MVVLERGLEGRVLNPGLEEFHTQLQQSSKESRFVNIKYLIENLKISKCVFLSFFVTRSGLSKWMIHWWLRALWLFAQTRGFITTESVTAD